MYKLTNIARCLLPFLAILLYLSSYPQTKTLQDADVKYRVVNWNFGQSFLYGRTNCFLKDASGFLWIGTANGLNRFDGSNFKNYFKSKNSRLGIISDNVFNLVQDSLHNIWIGTDHGLSRYDIKTDSFMNFTSDRLTSAGFDPIIPFWATRDEIFCMESDSIFTSYNIHSLVRKKWASLSKNIEHPDAVSQSIYEPKTNSVWLVPLGGGLSSSSGLFQISLSNGHVELHDWPCFHHIPNHFQWTEGMCYDRNRNSIWLNSPDGLIQFTLDDKQYHKINSVSAIDNNGVGIQMDQRDRVWMGTHKLGIIVYDPKTDSAILPFAADSALSRRVNGYNYRIYCDQMGFVWIGYWIGASMGIDQLIPYSLSVLQYPGDTHKPHALSTSFGADMTTAADKVWVFTWDGLNILDPPSGLFQFFPAKASLPGDKDKEISFLQATRSPQKALFTFNETGGLYEMELINRHYSPILLKDRAGHSFDYIHCAHEAAYLKNGEIVLMNQPGQLLFILEKDSPTAYLLHDFHNKHLNKITIAGESKMFMKFKDDTLGETYTIMNHQLVKINTVLDSLPWTNIVSIPNDPGLWVGGSGSLDHYDKNLHLIHRYGREDGIPLIKVWGIVPDDYGNIWFNTELAIAMLNPRTGKITVISEKDGWRKHEFKTTTSVAKDTYGDLYFYGYGGIDRIKPKQFIENYPPSSVYLKSIEINQRPFSLSTGINEVKELVLSYSENRIGIKTGIIDYYSKGNSQIRYRLDDNQSWQFGPTNATVYFESLPVGSHKLTMQASNAALEFDGPEKVLLLKISPPWWRSIWFYAAFGLTFIFSLWAFVRYRSLALQEKNIELEEKVLNRTKELKHSLEELRETQTQLIQREKMASLGELTAGIAHEIQNPLNFVNNFSEVNGELIEEMDQAFDHGNLAEARIIAHDIKNNIEKVIHHGKRADGIVKGMLLHSRASTGQKEPADINALADEYLRLSYHGLRAKDKSFNATLETHFDDTIGKINIIPQDIGRVLLNLFNNAFFSVTEKMKLQADGLLPGVVPNLATLSQEEYKPIVSISTKKLSSAIEIKVRDNGVGIPQKNIDKIYQPFFTTKPTGEGTGLGLSLSYDIITKAHGGELKVEAKEGEFAVFTILLPI